MTSNSLFIVAGPTASGKTAVAVALAKKIGGEVVSADSMQVYRGMNIGTAKPSKEEMEGIPHHLIDIINPDEPFSAAEFQKRATAAIADIQSRGKVPILAGGTGFYINAVLYGAEFSSEYNEREEILRENFTRLAKEKSPEILHDKLAAADPVYAAAIHPNNVKRVARALAYCEATGGLFSAHNAAQKAKKPLYDAVFCVLSLPREVLYERINARVVAMFEAGLEAEVRKLLQKFNKGLAAMQGIGYKEIAELGDGAVEAIKQATRNYAKRQQTWFRNQVPNACVVNAFGKTPQELAEEIIREKENLWH